MDIKGKTFLVTGGAQGMGRSFTLELAKLGANVMFCDLNAEKIAEVEREAARLFWSCRESESVPRESRFLIIPT